MDKARQEQNENWDSIDKDQGSSPGTAELREGIMEREEILAFFSLKGMEGEEYCDGTAQMLGLMLFRVFGKECLRKFELGRPDLAALYLEAKAPRWLIALLHAMMSCALHDQPT